MKTLILGFGVSGKAAAQFLKARGKLVIVVDKKPAEGILSEEATLPWNEIDQVVLSPGVPVFHPIVLKAKSLAIEVIGEVELALRELNQRIFAITGSNGKTTTVTLTTHILNAAGIKAKALGNVGESVSSYEPIPDEILILELSSFQLETLFVKKIEAALVLNITPNHLDRHPSFEAYAKAKANIQNCLLPDGELFVGGQVLEDFPEFFKSAFSFEKDLALLNELKYTQLMMPSKQSIQAAYLLCKRCGVTDVEFLRGLSTYKKAPHRIEWVAEINGVSYYNDSKSSNIHSVMHAVERIEGEIVLIVGGVHKGSSYKPWINSFQGKVRHIIAYGKAAPIMDYELSPYFPLSQIDRFADAVKLAKSFAKKKETVLLSPGCSSYDQFENYEQRGDTFKRLVREE